ncbi:MAG: hypothetical protein ACTS10_04595 [Kiloniellales bacterium]
MLGVLQPKDTPRQVRALLALQGFNVERPVTLDDKVLSEQSMSREMRLELISFLYRILDTLDSKTAHLLRLNSIILAGHSALIGLGLNQDLLKWQAILFSFPLLIPLFAVLTSLSIFRFDWKPLDFIPDRGRQGKYATFADELLALGSMCDRRLDKHSLVEVWLWLSVLALAASTAFLLFLS